MKIIRVREKNSSAPKYYETVDHQNNYEILNKKMAEQAVNQQLNRKSIYQSKSSQKPVLDSFLDYMLYHQFKEKHDSKDRGPKQMPIKRIPFTRVTKDDSTPK